MNEDDERPKVYLAGPIQHAVDGGHGWRDRVVSLKDYQTLQYLNPLDFFDGGEDKATILPEDIAEDYETQKGEFVITDEELVPKDKRMVNEADALLIGLPVKVPSWGTPMEQLYAWQGEISPSKPIVVWHGEVPYENLSPWMRYHTSFSSDSLRACVDHLEAQLNTVPLCVSCREDLGVNVDGVQFTTMDTTCERCEEHPAMNPESNL